MASTDLSEQITHFRYYTKRVNKYFFTAWINGVFAKIHLELNPSDTRLYFTAESQGIVEVTNEQRELIMDACTKELVERRLIFNESK